MSILSALVVLYAVFFNHASNAWITGGGNTERRRNARALTDYIASELKGAMLPVELLSSSAAGNLQFVINPSTSQVPDAYRHADVLFWQAPMATEASFGDIAEVGYFVKWDTAGGKTRPLLCRFFVNPSVTDSTGNIDRNSDFLIFDADPKSWLSGSLIEKVAPATKESGYAGVFGENVVGLWVRSYGLDGQELPREFDSREGYTCNFPGQGNTAGWSEKRYLPARVRVSIAQLDSHSAELLTPSAVARLQQLTSDTSIRDAEEFLEKFRRAAENTSPLSPLLRGLRIYSTEVQLANAR